jgi:hypothetical protein
MSSNLTKDPSSPELPRVVREWGWPAIKGLFLLIVISGIAGAVRSCASSQEDAVATAVFNPRENWSIVCDPATWREMRYCKLPKGACSAPIELDPADGKANAGKVLWFGPDKDGVVVFPGTGVRGGTNYQLCAMGDHQVEAWYKLIETPS